MSAPGGLCRVCKVCVGFVLRTLHSAEPRIAGLSGVLCKVCKVYAPAHACVNNFSLGGRLVVGRGWWCFFSYATPENPYTPYTPYTDALMPLFLKVFLCVWFVLGWAFLCRVGGGA